MPEDSKARMLTEQEAYAIAADRVQQETAALQEKLANLEAEKAQIQADHKTELQNQTDLHEAALQTERQNAEKVKKELADYQAQTQRDREISERKDERVAKMREVAKHLKDEWFTERAMRWAEMDEESFEALRREFAAVSEAGATETEQTEPPRETAMASKAAEKPKSGALRDFILGVNNSGK